MKILIFKLGALGDTLMTTPLIRQLRKHNPKANIDFLIGDSYKSAIERNKYIDEIIEFDENIFYKKRYSEFIKLSKKIRKKKYDIIYILDKHWIFSFFGFLCGIKKRSGFRREPISNVFLTNKVTFNKPYHEIQYYLKLINGNKHDYTIDLFINKKELDHAKTIIKKRGLKKVIALCPGGGINPGQVLKEKWWPIENYILLSKKLNEMNLDYMFVVWEGDKEVLKSLTKIKNVMICKTIYETASLMRLSNVIITSDGGQMHIASSTNRPIISIFGPTDPRRLAPIGDLNTYLWKAKSACYDIYGNYTKNDDNLTSKINVKEVLDEIKKVI